MQQRSTDIDNRWIREMLDVDRTKAIENQVRTAFGFPKAGINHNHESLLHLILRQLLPGRTILRRHRPRWLGRMELDFFIEDLRLALEFQGAQHSRPLEHLGGKKAYQALVRRDAAKAKLCRENGVMLIEFVEGRPLDESIVRDALRKVPGLELPIRGSVAHPPFDFFLRSAHISSRWTNYHDVGDLSISLEHRDGSTFLSGRNLEIFVTIDTGLITDITIALRQNKGTARASLKFGKDDKPKIEVRRETKSARDLFLLWATFDPRIVIHAAPAT